VHDNFNWIRMFAINSIGSIGDQSSVALLEPIAGDKNDPVSGSAKNAIEQIKKRLEPKPAPPEKKDKK
jgi:HEAT repeat protein